MLIGDLKVAEMIRFNTATKWWLKRSENSAPIYKFEGDHSTDEAVNAFSKVFETLEPGMYFLDCWTGDDKRGRQKTPFRKEGAGNNSNVDASINGVSIGDVDEIKRQAIEGFQKEVHYKELEEKVKGLEETQSNFFYKLGTSLEPYIPELIGALTKSLGGNPNLSGNYSKKKQYPKNETMAKENLTDAQIQEKVSELFSTWISKDPDAITLIEKIVTLIDEKPDTYNFAKNSLMNL